MSKAIESKEFDRGYNIGKEVGKEVGKEAYYDRCIKRIEEESFRDRYNIKILTTDFILLILKEELTVDNNSGNKKEKH